MIKHNSKTPLIAAHRGVSGANIPCNTKEAFNIPLMQGADIIELDVSKSRDGKLFVFHPGMEKAHLNIDCSLKELSADEIEKICFVNQDNVPTSYHISTLEEILEFLKDKAYINVDKYWENIEEITHTIRSLGVEKQVIVKTPAKTEYIDTVKKYAPDFAFMPLVQHQDNISDYIFESGLNYVGIEAIFSSEQDEIVSDSYIEKLHKQGLVIFGNAIVYNEKAVISAGHTDDVALAGNPDYGWGWFADKKFDIIQTDWCIMLKNYLQNRKNIHN